MSLDVYLEKLVRRPVFEGNITHNLGGMADAAGIYKALWRPEEIGVVHAWQLVDLLTDGLALLRSDPERFRAMEPDNGWGTYEGLCEFVEQYLAACKEHPDADVTACR